MELLAQVLLSLFVAYLAVLTLGVVLSVAGFISIFISRKEAIGLVFGIAAFGGLAFLMHRLIWIA